MNIRVLLSVLFLGIGCMDAQAGYYDGNKLVSSMREWDKANRNDAGANYMEATTFTAYAVGVLDTLEGSSICPPMTSSISQIGAVVAQYLNANPARWSEPAHRLVKDALKKAFPCRK